MKVLVRTDCEIQHYRTLVWLFFRLSGCFVFCSCHELPSSAFRFDCYVANFPKWYENVDHYSKPPWRVWFPRYI